MNVKLRDEVVSLGLRLAIQNSTLIIHNFNRLRRLNWGISSFG